MSSASSGFFASKKALWLGRGLSGLLSLLFLLDGALKVLQPADYMKASAPLGFDTHVMFGVGIAVLVSTCLYMLPKTCVLGAILLTGFLGGAVDANLRVGSPAFFIIYSVFLGVSVWAGVFLRDGRLRALIPLRIDP
jgi:DoxX-like family